MNKGFKVEPTAILKVEDSDGDTLEEVEPKKGRRVLTPEQSFMMVDMLSDNEARQEVFGLNSLLNISGRNVAVKTGTTNDKRDNWAIGGNMHAVAGVWVGNNDNTPMQKVASGISGASPIWRKIIMEALSGKPNLSFEVPGGIVTAAVDSVSGYAAHDGYSSRIEKFIDGTQPGEDPVHKKLKVCKNDGRLATPGDIASGNYDEKEYFIFKEEDPTAAPGEANKWQDGINAWLEGQGDERYHPPSDYCGTQNPVGIDFVSPSDRSSDLPNKFNVEIRADSTGDIVRVELEVDGSTTKTFDSRPFRTDLDLPTGVHTLKAIARDNNGNSSDREITIGVGLAWDYTPSPTPTPTQTPSPTPTVVIITPTP
jgi:hypothetical protein